MAMYPEFLPADIGAVVGSGPMRWASENMLVPHTDRIHHFLMGDYIPWDDDYVILESISKGIAVGRLSFYAPGSFEVYRRNLDGLDAEAAMLVRKKVAADLTWKGRSRYDWMLYLQLFAGAVSLMARRQFPPYDPAQLPYGRNKSYICTEAANFGWRLEGYSVIETGVVPTPAGFRKALNEGILTRVYPE